VMANATIPSHVSQFLAGHAGLQAALEPLFTSMFLHGGLMHLLGNMLFLWHLWDNVEELLRARGVSVLSILCAGIGSGLMHGCST